MGPVGRYSWNAADENFFGANGFYTKPRSIAMQDSVIEWGDGYSDSDSDFDFDLEKIRSKTVMPTTRIGVKPMSKRKIENFFDILASFIVPESELNWESPLDLVIAVVLSAQCTDKAVNKATAELWKRCRTADDYLELGEAGLTGYIRSIGLFRNKAKSILGICRAMNERFDNRVPDNREDLQSLPGVGRKTANVVLNVLFGQPTLAVDTHIFRVANRVGLATGNTPEAIEKILLKKIPKKHLHGAHHYLILHGRYTCKARKPNCVECRVSEYCNYPEKKW